jgi:hypothetical protein
MDLSIDAVPAGVLPAVGADGSLDHARLGKMMDRRCFLWRADGSSAGMFTLPLSATEYPPAIQIFHPWGSPYFRQDPHEANMYRSLS